MTSTSSCMPSVSYNIEKILGISEGQDNLKTYKVQWAPTWVSEAQLQGCEKLINEFLTRQKQLFESIQSFHEKDKQREEESASTKNDNGEEATKKNKEKIPEEDQFDEVCQAIKIEDDDDDVGEATQLDTGDEDQQSNDTQPTIVQAVADMVTNDTIPNFFTSNTSPLNGRPSLNFDLQNKALPNTNFTGKNIDLIRAKHKANNISKNIDRIKNVKRSTPYATTNMTPIQSSPSMIHSSFISSNFSNEQSSSLSSPPPNVPIDTDRDSSYTYSHNLASTMGGDAPGPSSISCYNSDGALVDTQTNTDRNVDGSSNVYYSTPQEVRDDVHSMQISMLLQSYDANERCNLYSCEMCSEVFSNIAEYKRHIQIHLRNKSFQCKKCPKKFPTVYNLKMHEQSHNEERPFACHICGRTFKAKSVMVTHIKRTHSQEKNHKCTICPKSFHTRFDLQRHERTHTGERPYVCVFCSKRFKMSCVLTKHTRICKGRGVTKHDGLNETI